MEQDFQLALKKFWQTVLRLRRGKLQTSTESIVQWWREYFKDPLKPTSMHSKEEAELEYFGLGCPITGFEVSRAVRQPHSSNTPGVDEIRPELLKALDVVGAVIVDTPVQHCVGIGDCAFGVADSCDGSTFQEGGPPSHFSASLGRSTPGDYSC